MSVALVQTATQVDVAASSTTAPSIVISGTAGGNALTAFASIWDANTTWTLDSTTDGGNTFVTRQGSATDVPGGAMQHGAVAFSVNITGGDRTVAFNLSGNAAGANRYYTLGCQEWSGVEPVTPEDTFDVNEEIDTSGATDTSAGPITTTDAADLIVGCASVISATDANLTLGSPASWVNSYRQNSGSTIVGMDAGYWLPGSIQTTYTAQWSHDNNANDRGAGIVVALKPAGTAPGVNAPTQRSRGHDLKQMADAQDEGRFNELDVRNWFSVAFA